ncbi:hypothetical protein ABL78_2319 [Leptomonas seymouri]|uniref:BRCT domain-containing protein n=1 Tax=Leptomonas seymouri TaxID=5684 RepID=A0A0N0P7A7_LEPSE|nr:hypothetical protein ABL78_2319 [Leptomonas seymouri]|eukprot:KPI88586.1 hypothetical protein ABL78_2319 [Leptomonas seymouri]
MFTGHTFCVSSSTSPLTVAALTQRGGCVVYTVDHPTPITCVVIANENVSNMFEQSPAAPHLSLTMAAARGGRDWAVRNKFPVFMEDRVRSARIPVVYELWVHQCMCAGRLLLPCKGSREVVAYDPFLFSGLCFTTTQLPLQLKANIVAILQFYGAEYHRNLLDTTNTVVYSHMRLKDSGSACDCSSSSSLGACSSTAVHQESPPAATASTSKEPVEAPLTKLSVARERGIACVTPQWVQLCLNAGELLPHTSPSVAAGATVPAPHDEAAGTLCGSAESTNETKAYADMEKFVSDALDSIDQKTVPGTSKSSDASSPPSSLVSSSLPILDTAAEDAAKQPLRSHSKTSRSVEAMEADPEVRAALMLADRLAVSAPARTRKRRRCC